MRWVKKPIAAQMKRAQTNMTYVVDGNKCANIVPQGQYFQLINSTIAGRSDGVYTASKAIPANEVIDNTYFNQTSPISEGAINKINNELASLNSNIANIAKIYRITVTNESVASNHLLNLQADYLTDSFISVTNNNEIHFSEPANILVLVTVVGKTSNGGRGWIKLQGGNTVDDSIAYGEYVTLIISAVYAVTASTVLTIKNNDSEAFTVGGGGVPGSRIKIIRL